MTVTIYQIVLRTNYDERTHRIVVRLGRGRRPRAATATHHTEALVELDGRGRLVGAILLDNKFVRLGQRLAGLPVLPPESPVPAADAITYDLAGRVARVCIQGTSDEPQRIPRTVQIDVDGEEHLLAIHIPIMGARRRDPDLSVALGYLART